MQNNIFDGDLKNAALGLGGFAVVVILMLTVLTSFHDVNVTTTCFNSSQAYLNTSSCNACGNATHIINSTVQLCGPSAVVATYNSTLYLSGYGDIETNASIAANYGIRQLNETSGGLLSYLPIIVIAIIASILFLLFGGMLGGPKKGKGIY